MSVSVRIRAAIRSALEHRFPPRLPRHRPQIVVSLTTSPTRISKIAPAIDSILNQQVQPDLIVLNVPHVFRRDGSRYRIPDWLASVPRLRIHRTEDWGPATKLLGTLELIRDPDAMIVTVDDDILYPDLLLRHLVRCSLRDPGSVWAVSAGLPDYDNQGGIRTDGHGIRPSRTHGQRVTMLEGFAGVIYRRRHLADDLFDLPGTCETCYLADDLVFSFYLAMRGIPIRVVRNSIIRRPWEWACEYGLQGDALQHIGRENGPSGNAMRYHTCLKALRERFPDVAF